MSVGPLSFERRTESVEGQGLTVRYLRFAIQNRVPEGLGEGAPLLEREAFLGGKAPFPSSVSGRESTREGEAFLGGERTHMWPNMHSIPLAAES